MSIHLKHNKGFTLLEMIVVIGVFVIMVVASISSVSSFYSQRHLETYTHQVAHVLRMAQANSITRLNDGAWGVYFDDINDKFILFKGDTFIGRDQSFDKVYALDGSIGIANIALDGGGGSGMSNELIFERVTGEASNAGSLQVKDITNFDSNTITINPLGQIEIE